MNVHVELLTETSVNVSWNRIIANEITNYTVYYRPSDNMMSESLTVPSSESFVVIDGLVANVEYQFQVAAIAELGGQIYPGQKSPPVNITLQLSTTLHAMR